MCSTSYAVAHSHAHFIDAAERRALVNHHLKHPDEFDADVDDQAPMDEIEYEEYGGVDTAVEVELLVARMQATRFWGV
jgi:hypothetical protein